MSFTSKMIKAGLAGSLSIAGLAASNKHLTKKYTSVNKTHEYKAFSWRYTQGKINYLKRGSGKPLLLIHNLSVYDSCYEFSKVIDKLAERRTVYAMDLPGCGHSDKPKMTYTAFTFVQVIYMFINEVVGEKTDIIATGLSGAYAVVAKKNFCDKIGNIVLVDPVSLSSLATSPSGADSLKKDLLNLPVTGSFIYNMATSPVGSMVHSKSLFNASGKDVSRETSKVFCESAHIGGSGGKYLFNSIKRRFVYVDIREHLKDLDGLSIICGSSASGHKKCACGYKEINKSIRICEIPGSGHVPHFQSPARFLTIINRII